MHDAMEQIEKGFLIFAVLLFIAVLLLDWAIRKARLESMFGNTVKPAVFPAGGIEDSSFRLFWTAWVVFKLTDEFLLRPVVRSHAPWSPGWRTVFLAVYAAVPLVLLTLIYVWWRSRPKNVFQLSRGLLFDTARRMTNKLAPLALMETPVYLIPNPDCARTCARFGRGVVLPLPLLDILNRKEIDALVARQLCQQTNRSSRRKLWTLLASNAAIVIAVGLFHPGVVISCLAYASFLSAELWILFRWLPCGLIEADLRAMRLTGDPGSFVSALRGLESFGGKPLEPKVLQEIARAAVVSKDRLADLREEPTTPATDRYPTSGSYLETGF
jgi:Zn-dependent protease with chaperone function